MNESYPRLVAAGSGGPRRRRRPGGALLDLTPPPRHVGRRSQASSSGSDVPRRRPQLDLLPAGSTMRVTASVAVHLNFAGQPAEGWAAWPAVRRRVGDPEHGPGGSEVVNRHVTPSPRTPRGTAAWFSCRCACRAAGRRVVGACLAGALTDEAGAGIPARPHVASSSFA